MVTDPLRVVVLARHRLLSQALAEALSAEPGIDVVERTLAASDALGCADVDVLVVSLEAGAAGGALELVGLAPEDHPGLGVVLIAEPGRTDLTREALERGVRGWVASDEPLVHLVATVKGVGSHGVCIPVAVLKSAFASDLAPTADTANLRLLRLTPRQRQVLRCLVEGRSRSQTGLALAMSENTVRTHVGAILRRLQVHSTLAAVTVAREAGLLGRTAEVGPTANDVARLGR